MRIITAAANLIKSICIRYETNVYPSKANIELGAEFLPPTLKLFVNCSSGTMFQTSIIGQMYFRNNKTKQWFTSFLFGLGVENDHGIGSKTLLTEISKLGYAISYDEVKRYKQSVSMDEDHKLDHIKDVFTHLVVGNVDY